MKRIASFMTLLVGLNAAPAIALSMAPEEFLASRAMACVLAQQSLGQLSEDEYGARAHAVLDGFDEVERDNIIAKALGYYDGLMFAIPENDLVEVNHRLSDFLASGTCSEGFQQVTHRL